MSYSSSTVRATLSGLSAQIVFMQVPGFTVTYQPASLIEVSYNAVLLSSVPAIIVFA
uniref:Protein kinase domain-containing protein n=1 Tax=Parascaris univalens TaxID=6257 RepID=A0A914ZMB1_PARUN